MSTELGYLHAYLDYIGRNGKNAAGYSDFIITCLYSRLGDIDNALKYAKETSPTYTVITGIEKKGIAVWIDTENVGLILESNNG